MNEAKFQNTILKPRLKDTFPGCIVMKNDPNIIQGIPDLTVLYQDKYALLEVKKSRTASHQPNQDYYIEEVQNMGGYARFVYPENLEEVLVDMHLWFNK